MSGDRHWLSLLARLGYFEGVWSTFIAAELVRIRVEHSIARGVERSVYRQRINDLTHLLTAALRVVRDPAGAGAGRLNDPDDEPILATALAARAESIVLLNTRDFPPDGLATGVRFLTPTEFLTVLEARHSHEDLGDRVRDAGRQLP